MTQDQNAHRVLGIAPVSRGFGYAVLDGIDNLADWGLKILDGDQKNARALIHIKRLILVYQPRVLVIEDFWQKSSNRANRIKQLGEGLLGLAKSLQVNTQVVQRERVWALFAGHTAATKFEVAQIVAAKFTDDLQFCLPVKRKLWKAEDSRFAIFIAVAMALFLQRPRKP